MAGYPPHYGRDMPTERPDRNLALELVRTTESAAMAASRWVGRGDKIGADGAAVDAMRMVLGTVPMSGIVVIGEGEKDEAPMLFNGEVVGDGSKPDTDVAVDPIDGTVNFAYGIPHAAVSIALQVRTADGFHSEVGVVYDPFMNDLWTAIRGKPARLNGRITQVSTRARLDESIVSLGFAKNQDSLEAAQADFLELTHRVRKLRIMGSAALALTYVACGRFDAYVEAGVRLWDIAAGGLIVECDLHAVGDLCDITGDTTGNGRELGNIGKHRSRQRVAGGARLADRRTQLAVGRQPGRVGDGGLPFAEQAGRGEQHDRIGRQRDVAIDAKREHHPSALAEGDGLDLSGTHAANHHRVAERHATYVARAHHEMTGLAAEICLLEPEDGGDDHDRHHEHGGADHEVAGPSGSGHKASKRMDTFVCATEWYGPRARPAPRTHRARES